MNKTNEAARQRWEESFEEQIAQQAYNTAPVEAVVRNVSYYLRARFSAEQVKKLHFLEMGCGAGPNLVWLAQRGITVSGVDISPTALRLAQQKLEQGGFRAQIGQLIGASVSEVPFGDESFDGIIEACVFQHLTKEDRVKAFCEVKRLLKPGGVFVGYMLAVEHTVFQLREVEQLPEDPGTLILNEGGAKFYLTNLGVSHFFRAQEIIGLFDGLAVVDPCLTTFYLPREEAHRRGYPEYLQSNWTVYAIK